MERALLDVSRFWLRTGVGQSDGAALPQMFSPGPAARELPEGSLWVMSQSEGAGASPGTLQPGWWSLTSSHMSSSHTWPVAVKLGLRLEHFRGGRKFL